MNIKKFKYGTMFLAGFAASVFAVYAASTTTIETNLDNAVQYIKKIVIKDDTGNTGLILENNLSQFNASVIINDPYYLSAERAIFHQGVGIGTTTPKAKLHVNGAIIVGTDTTCNTGAIIFNEDSHFYGCNGTTWKQLDN